MHLAPTWPPTSPSNGKCSPCRSFNCAACAAVLRILAQKHAPAESATTTTAPADIEMASAGPHFAGISLEGDVEGVALTELEKDGVGDGVTVLEADALADGLGLGEGESWNVYTAPSSHPTYIELSGPGPSAGDDVT